MPGNKLYQLFGRKKGQPAGEFSSYLSPSKEKALLMAKRDKLEGAYVFKVLKLKKSR